MIFGEHFRNILEKDNLRTMKNTCNELTIFTIKIYNIIIFFMNVLNDYFCGELHREL